MIHLPDCSVTDTHARGLRRAEDRWVDARRSTWKIQRNPRRFGPRVRQMYTDLLGQYGAGRVILTECSKKSAHWFVASRVSDDLYRLLRFSIERTHHAAPRTRSSLPLVSTGHCYERFIQGLLRHGSDWAGIMHGTFMSLLTAADCRGEQESPNAAKKAHWHAPGDYKVWLPQGLVVVEVPEYGDAIMKTVIAAFALIGPNRDLWETLGTSEIKAERFVRHQGPDWFELHAESPLADDVVDSEKLCA